MIRLKTRTMLSAIAVLLLFGSCTSSPNVAYKELLDEDAGVRADAIRKLGDARVAEAVPSLLEMLDDPSEEVRVTTLIALRDIGDPSVVDSILPLAGDPMRSVRVQLGNVLMTFADAVSIETLGNMMYDEDDTVRITAARALGSIDDPAAIEVLLQNALVDENETVRQHVVRVIGERGYRGAIPRLEDALYGEADIVRANAAAVLGEVGDATSLPVLYEALEDPFYKVRSLAAHSISFLAEEADASAAADRLYERIDLEEAGIVRVDLAWALARIGDRRGMELLRDQLFRGNPEDVRAEAAMALGEVGMPEDVALLERAIKDKKGLVRHEVWRAIQKLKEA